MAMIVAVERKWITRAEAIGRLARILGFWKRPTVRGTFPHFFDETGEEFTFWDGNAGGDIVETAFLMVGLLCARQYFTKRMRRKSAFAAASTGSGMRSNGAGSPAATTF